MRKTQTRKTQNEQNARVQNVNGAERAERYKIRKNERVRA